MRTTNYQLTASEFNWEISENRIIKAWGFNESLPGPVLKAKKGDMLNIEVKNNLNEPTLIHWHGIQLPASMDGTGEVQKPIMPGETFTYRFTVPDAGTFWYHSHKNEIKQMERGMYGALIVEDDKDPHVDADRVFMIDDMKLNNRNEFKKGNAITRWMERHDGREGETILINGQENFTIEMNAGQIERWRWINSASARYIRLHMSGRPFRIIGTDGGLLELPQETTEIMLVPGERVDIVAGPYKKGETFAIESLPYNRMASVKPKLRKLASVIVKEDKPSIAFIPKTLRSIEPLALQDAIVSRKVKLSVAPSFKNIIDFKVNDALHSTDSPVYVGELQIWEVSNTSLMDHPWHLHGFFFQVLELNGEAPAYLAWKDTINLPPKSKVKIAWIPDNRPGIWMYHCHILEHHEAGMMALFEVIDPAKGAIHSVSVKHTCNN